MPAAGRTRGPRGAAAAAVSASSPRAPGPESRGRWPVSAAAVQPVLHHRAHGLYAFASSGYDDAAVLIVDSLGERQTTTIAHATRCTRAHYRIVGPINDPASLGLCYGAVTEHLGWRRGDEEGTVMALAALGDPARFRDLFAHAVRSPRRASHSIPACSRCGCSRTPPPAASRAVHRRDLPTAATRRPGRAGPPRPGGGPSGTHRTGHAPPGPPRPRAHRLPAAVRRRRCRHQLRRLGKIIEAGMFDEVHVPPAPGDSGTAIGAALAVHLAGTGAPDRRRRPLLPRPVLPGRALRPAPCGPACATPPGPAGPVPGRQLAHGPIVGLFQGRLEAGPRALGNRSILASPLLPDVVERLNATVKFREPFRPFAPVVLADAASDYFTLGQPAPYMSIASGVTDLTRSTSPPSCTPTAPPAYRPSPGAEPVPRRRAHRFAAMTGVPVLINTSLNVKGKPICGTRRWRWTA